MTQDNILVSPTLSACLKPGVQSLRSRHSVSGDTAHVAQISQSASFRIRGCARSVLLPGDRVPNFAASPSFPSFPSVKAFRRSGVKKSGSLISNDLQIPVYIKTHWAVFLFSAFSAASAASAVNQQFLILNS